MCNSGCIDWAATGSMVSGIGTWALVLLAIATMFIQWGARRREQEQRERADKLERLADDLDKYWKMTANEFATFYSSFQGMGLTYPKDEAVIVREVASKVGLPEQFVRRLLRRAYEDGNLSS